MPQKKAKDSINKEKKEVLEYPTKISLIRKA